MSRGGKIARRNVSVVQLVCISCEFKTNCTVVAVLLYFDVDSTYEPYSLAKWVLPSFWRPLFEFFLIWIVRQIIVWFVSFIPHTKHFVVHTIKNHNIHTTGVNCQHHHPFCWRPHQLTLRLEAFREVALPIASKFLSLCNHCRTVN